MSRSDNPIDEEDPLAAMQAQLIVIKRVLRMAGAVRRIIHLDARLRSVFGSDADPIMQRIAEPWKFSVLDRQDKDFMFSSVGMEFQVKNYSPPEEV